MTNPEIELLRSRVHNGVFEHKNKGLFEGAGIVVAGKPAGKGAPENPGLQYVFSERAAELSSIIYSLRDIFLEKIDFLSKYAFYGRLAEAANAYLSASGDDAGVFDSVLDEARRLWAEAEL